MWSPHVLKKSGYSSLETGFFALKVKWQKGNTKMRMCCAGQEVEIADARQSRYCAKIPCPQRGLSKRGDPISDDGQV